MARKQLNVAVIGSGSIARFRHLPEYCAHPDVKLIALVDPNKRRAARLADEFGVEHVFTKYEDALALGPDAVSVCTPNVYHAEQSIAALKAKAHVLCEKPMALTLPEARKMIRAAKTARRQLMIGHNQRFASSHVRGKEILDSGILGKPLAFRTTFAHAGPENWSADGLKCFFFKRRLSGMGSLADLGVHKIDLLRWLLGEEFVQASAMTDTLAKKNCQVDDTAFALLKTESGAIGNMFTFWAAKRGEDNSTIIYCTKGVLKLGDDPQFTVVAELNNGERQCFQTAAIQTNAAGGQTSSGVIDAFVESIQTGRKNPVPGEEGARSLAAVLACVEAEKTRRTVRVKKV